MLFIATRKTQKYLPIGGIAEELGISFHFLTKILQTLTQKKILHSYRGPNGGISLARPSETLKLIEIVDAIDGSEALNSCLLGLPGCGVLKPCPLHDEWGDIRKRIHEMLNHTTVAELAKKVIDNNLRLSEIDPLAT